MTEAMAIRVRETGGVENMRAEKITLPPPGAGEALVRNRAVGVNFIDVYHRSGLYPAAAPFVLGMEGAGVVEAVGEGGGGWRPGARVGYCVGGMGAYADCRLIKTDALIPLPDDLPFEEAAAVLLKGMTAEYLIRRVYRVRRGDSVLFHAAAGGVGLVACQWLKQLGATVIGTVGGEKKADIAKANGCDNVILYNREDVAARARELTGGSRRAGRLRFGGTRNFPRDVGIARTARRVCFLRQRFRSGGAVCAAVAGAAWLFVFHPPDFNGVLPARPRHARFGRGAVCGD